MTLDALLSQLQGVRPRGTRFAALCPAHADRSPSLSVSGGDRGILLRCWAGCSVQEICERLGLQQKDLFFETLISRGQRPIPKPPRIVRVSLAFRFELAALDLRLRAERIIEAGKRLDVASLSDDELDLAIGLAAQAHADIEGAELFEGVADHLRLKEFKERDHARRNRVA